MRNLIAGSIFALMVMLAISSVAMAQTGNGLNNTLYNKLNADPSTGGPAPKQDLSGAWAGPLSVAASEEIAPMTPLGEKLFSLNKSERMVGIAHSNDPLNTCDPLGFPRDLVFETRGLAFATMPGKIVLLHQYQKIWRDVWMDGRELPKNIDTKSGPDSRWYGYSVGHWEGDNTLVIDTVGSDDSSWLGPRGYPHSVEAHVQERYTRVDHNHLQMTVTIDDPKIYTKPFVLGTSNFRWVPTQETDEQICVASEAINYVNTISIPAVGESPKSK
jgi:hypothetical protein